MADISLIDPYSAKQESIARQRRMAQALQQQAQSPIETPQMPGVLISPYAGLAKVLQGAYGGYQEAEADKEYRALAEEARTNQAEDLAKVFGAARAPARPEIAGQEAVMDMPERIIPGQTISQYGGTLNIPGQTIPKVAYQPAIAPQPARPAGYISPELIADIKDPTARNLALAQLIKQAEPETFIKGSPGDVFYDRFGNKKFSIPAAAGTTTLSPLGRLQSERDAIFAINPKDPRLAELNAAIAKETKTETAALSPLGKLQSERAAIFASNPNDSRLVTYDKAIAKEAEDQRLAFDQEKYEYEKGHPGFTLEKIKNKDGSESVMAVNKGSAVARTVVGPDGKALTSAAQEKTPIYSDVVRDGKIYKMDLNKPESKDNLIFVKDLTPDLEKVEITTKEGFPAFRFFPKDELVKLGEIPMQAKGIFLDLAQAGQLPLNWREIPEISSFVRQYLINQAGGITPKFLADLDVRVKEATARLGDQGIKFSATVPRADNYLTLGGAQPASAAAPATSGTKAAPLPLPPKGKEKDYFKAGNYYQTDKGVLLFNGSKFVE